MVSAFSAEAETIVKVVDGPWLPYCGPSLPNYGIVPEIVNAAYAETAYKPEFETMSWSRAIGAVKDGKFDAVCTASYSEERARIYRFSDYHLESRIVFFKRRDSDISWKNLKSLIPYRIIVLKGYNYSPSFDRADYLQKVTSRSEVLGFKKLFYKQADLLIMDRLVGLYTIREKLIGREQEAFDYISPPLCTNKRYMMFSPESQNVSQKIEAFNRGLKIIRKNGELMRILKKYGLK